MSDERTMEPTPRRREQARREGRFPRSRELAVGALLLSLLAVLHFVGASWLQSGTDAVRGQLARPASLRADAHAWIAAGRSLLAAGCLILIPWFAASAATIMVAQWIQGGLVWLPARIRPELARVCGRGPSTVAKLIQALFAVLAFCAGLAILGTGLWMLREPLCELGYLDLPVSLAIAARLLSQLMLPVLAACVALCGLEYGIRLRAYHASLKMSAAELRDEITGRNRLQVAPTGSGTERRREFEQRFVQDSRTVPRPFRAVAATQETEGHRRLRGAGD